MSLHAGIKGGHMNGKKSVRAISIITAFACVFALIAGIAGFSNGLARVNEKKSDHAQFEARLVELTDTMNTIENQRADYDALKADYASASDEYDVQLDEHQAIVQDYEGSVLDYNQGLIGDAGLQQLNLALSLSSNINMVWDRNELAKSKSAYERGLKEYEAVKQTYDEANAQLQSGRYAYQQGLDQFNAAKQQIADGQVEYDRALDIYNSSYSMYKRITDGLALIEKYGILHQLALRTISGQIGQEITDSVIADIQSRFEAAEAQLNEIGTQLEQAKAVVANGEGQIEAAGAQLRQGEAQLADMKSKLDAGLVELNAAKEMLDAKAKPSGKTDDTPLPSEALPEDSELRKAQIALAGLERISSIDSSLLDSPEGLDQASELVKKNELILSNYKLGLDNAKKALDNYDLLVLSLERGSSQLISEGYGAEGSSAGDVIKAAQSAADKQKMSYSFAAVGNTVSLILMLAAAAGAVLTLIRLAKKPEKAFMIAACAAGAALIAMILRRFAFLNIVTVALLAVGAALLFDLRKAEE